MIRKKIMNDLKDRIKMKENAGFLRIWAFKDGKPFLESSTPLPNGKTVNILQYYDADNDVSLDADIFKDFDLNAIANEPETINRLKPKEKD